MLPPRAIDARWAGAPLADLIDHIVTTYHRPLPATIARLRELAATVFAPEPDRGARADRALSELDELLREHTEREEELVFPWLRATSGSTAGLVVQQLEHEHADLIDRAHALRALAAGAGRSRATRALVAQLDRLARELADHVRLEQAVLFPRALARR